MKRNASYTPRPARRLGAAVFHAHPPPHRGELSRRTAGESAQNCVIAPAAATAAAGIGSMVRICDLRTGERDEYILVPPAAADIRLNRISTLSPIGRAVFGRRAGETVEVDAPAGAIVVRIERVRRARKEAGMRRKP